MANKSSSEQIPFLLLGRVLRPHGIRGELRLEVLTAYPERIVRGKRLYIGPDPQNPESATVYTVTKSRKHQHFLILQLDEISDRNEAELMRDLYVMVPPEEAVPLEEGEFYLYQLIGLTVHTDDDELLGELTEVIETGANDVYIVQGPRGEVLLPAIDECILDIDFDNQTMTVHLLDGLLGD
jgi:16S rRNA processing protein RimM